MASAMSGLGNALGGVCFVLAGTSLILRLRRSHGRARQQVKWFVYVGAVVLVCLSFALLEIVRRGAAAARSRRGPR